MKTNFSQKLFAVFLFTICAVFSSRAQNINTNPYWPGTITLKDGMVKDGWIMVPNSSKENNIAFRTTKKDPKETVKRADIATVTVTSETGKEYLYENIPAVITIKGNASMGTSLLLVTGKNNYVTFYVESQRYRVDEETGEIILFYRYRQGYDIPTTTYYIRKKGAEKANMFYMTGHLGGIKKGVKHNLTEDPALQKRVEDKELTADDLPEIINTYLATTKSL